MNSAKLRNFYFGLLQTRVGLILSYLFRSGYFVRLSCVQFGRKFIAIWKSREFSNFTYFLRDESYEYLPYFVSNIVGCTAADAERVIKELELDQELALYCSLETERSKRRLSADPTFKPGRLLLHYAIVRLTKPRLVFEAGLDKGFGAIILNRALQKNKDEGFQSDYIGVEYRVDRPAFLIENYPNPVGRIVYASWSEVFEGLSAGTVDFFF